MKSNLTILHWFPTPCLMIHCFSNIEKELEGERVRESRPHHISSSSILDGDALPWAIRRISFNQTKLFCIGAAVTQAPTLSLSNADAFDTQPSVSWENHLPQQIIYELPTVLCHIPYYAGITSMQYVLSPIIGLPVIFTVLTV